FSGSGNFTTTGVQTVTVTGSGTPINSGTFNYTFSLGGSTCSRDVTYVASSNPAIDPCTKSYLGKSDFPNTYMINGQPVYVTVSITGHQENATGNGSGCGWHTTTDAWIIGGNNVMSTLTFTFSQPVSGVKFNNGGIYSNAGQQATVTAKNGSVDISNPTLTTTQGCNSVPTVVGNKIKQPGTFTVTDTVTSITISHQDNSPPPYNQGGVFNIILCPTAK
ncbi:hypothetical protein SAMN05880574_1431, partial [Chryseobacterium sp. RU37D]|uniref:hypothetical protein n=1 Tax=Chryseobacterium sp. RU37D TaxID=1907397 RepID=UPI00095618E2